MKSRELQQTYWDWLSTGERLHRVLAEQTLALKKRDVARVESLQPDLDRMLDRMKEIDRRAAAVTTELAEAVGAAPKLRSIVAVLNPAEARTLESLLVRVEAVGRNLQELMDRNRTLLENELTFVGGTLALVARAVRDQQGQFGGEVPSAVLVDQVA